MALLFALVVLLVGSSPHHRCLIDGPLRGNFLKPVWARRSQCCGWRGACPGVRVAHSGVTERKDGAPLSYTTPGWGPSCARRVAAAEAGVASAGDRRGRGRWLGV